MTISIWRYSHLTLAITSALFIIIASITGIILAFEPISNQLKPYNPVDLNTISIAETITVLQNEYNEIIELEIDENSFVSVSVITNKGESKTFYINPKTGKKVGDIIKKAFIFEFATNLHRSLFLKSTGRFLVGFFSLLLFLIALTGTILIGKRQGGFLKIFTKIVKEDFNQYYHIIFGRWFLTPVIIITLTGVYLSLEKFSWLPKDNNTHQNLETENNSSKLKITDFEIFKSTKLDEVKKIELPFSNEEEDFFYVKLQNKELAIHQYNGQIVSKKKLDFITLASNYSLILHTGKGSVLWSLILLLACFAILFFIFSGFSMTLNRRKKTVVVKNKINQDEAEYIILVGSETGSTIRFANTFKNTLLKANKSTFLTKLNNITTFKKAKNLIIFTATYGNGDAPTNANKFIKLINTVRQIKPIKYAVVGFGSKDYPEFCKFAILVHASLQILPKYVPLMPLFKIDNQNIESFKKWTNEWCVLNKFSLEINVKELLETPEKEVEFIILEKSSTNRDDTFLIVLKPKRKITFVSGDILSITPKNENRSRLYSIAKIDKYILLSVKKHEFGVCSNYLQQLQKGDFINGSIKNNQHFHFPKKAKEVVLIANGTGIAPFLGMIHKNKGNNKIHLFWGGKTVESIKLYSKYLENISNKPLLTSLNIAYSNENKHKRYVQDLIKKEQTLIVNVLKNNGVILICGSIDMQRGVEAVINTIISKHLNSNIRYFKEKNQIKADCY